MANAPNVPNAPNWGNLANGLRQLVPELPGLINYLKSQAQNDTMQAQNEVIQAIALRLIRMENRLSPADAVIQYPDGTPQNALQQLPLPKRDVMDITGAQAIDALQLLGVDPPALNANPTEHFLEFIGIEWS